MQTEMAGGVGSSTGAVAGAGATTTSGSSSLDDDPFTTIEASEQQPLVQHTVASATTTSSSEASGTSNSADNNTNNNNSNYNNHNNARSAVSGVLTLVMCCGVCSVATGAALNIAALAVGYNKQLRDHCDFGATSASKFFVSPNYYLVIGGWCLLACLLVQCVLFSRFGLELAKLVIDTTSDEESKERSLVGLILGASVMKFFGVVQGLFMLAWGAVGFVLYHKTRGGGCRGKPATDMTIAYAVLVFLFGLAQLCQPTPKPAQPEMTAIADS